MDRCTGRLIILEILLKTAINTIQSNQESMDRCTGRPDITEILLKTALKTIQLTTLVLFSDCLNLKVTQPLIGQTKAPIINHVYKQYDKTENNCWDLFLFIYIYSKIERIQKIVKRIHHLRTKMRNGYI